MLGTLPFPALCPGFPSCETRRAQQRAPYPLHLGAGVLVPRTPHTSADAGRAQQGNFKEEKVKSRAPS